MSAKRSPEAGAQPGGRPRADLEIAPTLAPADAGRRPWDVLVIGAGPAGALAAREVARAGAAVLLVEKRRFPRPKVCGCCLNGAALAVLERAGLGGLPAALGAIPLRRVCLAAGGRRASLRLPGGVALSREAFDVALVRAAVAAGAEFLPETQATVACPKPLTGQARHVRLEGAGADGGSTTAAAPVVLCADGLGGRSLREHPEFAVRIAGRARVGGAALFASGTPAVAPGTIHMNVAAGGYVGVVRLEDGRINVAAAFDVPFLKQQRGLGAAALAVLTAAGAHELPDPSRTAWRGVAELTRTRRRLASDGVFVIGDAAGYVEPFTGEGMAWALMSAAAVVPFALAALDSAPGHGPADWERTYHRLLDGRRRHCELVARALRWPRAVGAGVALLGYGRGIAAPYLRALNMGSAAPI